MSNWPPPFSDWDVNGGREYSETISGSDIRRLRDAALMMNQGKALFCPDLLIDAANEIERLRNTVSRFEEK